MRFLDTLMNQKRADVAARKKRRSLAELEAEARAVPLRDFRDAIAPAGSIIAELKARTPTIKFFAQSANLEGLATIYEKEGAAAISIVTDERNFGTSLDTVVAVKERISLPILVKDFVFDKYQLVEARAAGADAILLIVRLLDRSQLTNLHADATSLGMSVLVETHDERELRVALEVGASIIGINNRNLDTMTTDLDTTRRLAGQLPPGTILVSESGIETRADIDDLARHGVNAFLIGGSLLASELPDRKLREFLGRN